MLPAAYPMRFSCWLQARPWGTWPLNPVTRCRRSLLWWSPLPDVPSTAAEACPMATAWAAVMIVCSELDPARCTKL